MFDTHCHLNFKAYKKTLHDVIKNAHAAGVTTILIPGTDVKTSRQAIEIASSQKDMYVAVGIHPHHVFEMVIKLDTDNKNVDTILAEEFAELEQMVQNPHVVAVGECGIDRHMYVQTKYNEYHVTDEFVQVQKVAFARQIELAKKYNKALILHNREASDDTLQVLTQNWDKKLEYKTVFHCCEPSKQLLSFSMKHHIFIGVDGDITYSEDKYEFIKSIPHDMLVLETDAPFLLPEPLRAEKKYPNVPANLPLIADVVARIWNISAKEVAEITEKNGKRLFGIS